MKKLVILTGAGISAESGLQTFRDAGGLWEGHRIEDVATPEGWERNPVLVQEFYNERRKAVLAAEPNAAHKALALLQKDFDVQLITQNIDDLHERAGSKKVLHLHGIITLAQSDVDSALTYPINGWEIKPTDLCSYGRPLRPHVVWFGEAVPNMDLAIQFCKSADIFAVIGSKLAVYPAAGLLDYVPSSVVRYIIDPDIPYISGKNVRRIQATATAGVPVMAAELLSVYG